MLAVIVTWIHVTVAMFWIGGMLFFSLVFLPCLRGGLSDTLKTDLISRVGKRFRVCGWISLGMLLVTGLLRLSLNGRPLSAYGNALKVKLILVCVMVLLTLVHDFILGPKSIRQSRSGLGSSPLLIGVRWMARLNLVVGLLIVLAALFLARGIPF